MSDAFSHDRFDNLPLVGILRGFRLEQIAPIAEAGIAGGLTNLEITMNSDGAADQIRAAIDAAEGRMNIGAGTVTSIERLEQALQAGASFIVPKATTSFGMTSRPKANSVKGCGANSRNPL